MKQLWPTPRTQRTFVPLFPFPLKNESPTLVSRIPATVKLIKVFSTCLLKQPLTLFSTHFLYEFQQTFFNFFLKRESNDETQALIMDTDEAKAQLEALEKAEKDKLETQLKKTLIKLIIIQLQQNQDRIPLHTLRGLLYLILGQLQTQNVEIIEPKDSKAPSLQRLRPRTARNYFDPYGFWLVFNLSSVPVGSSDTCSSYSISLPHLSEAAVACSRQHKPQTSFHDGDFIVRFLILDYEFEIFHSDAFASLKSFYSNPDAFASTFQSLTPDGFFCNSQFAQQPHSPKKRELLSPGDSTARPA